jgi:hypothetical protein
MSEVEGLVPSERAGFEVLCLANSVEVQNGLLYIMGGGWTDHKRPVMGKDGHKVLSQIYIAILIKIPWNETNRNQHFVVEITDLDGTKQLLKVEGDFSTGRPATLPPGSAQYAPLAVNGQVLFESAGTYLVKGRLNGDPLSLRTWEFRVHDLPAVS